MRLIGLAVALTLGLLAPLAAEAQRVPEIGILVFGTGSRNINIDRVAEPLRAALRDFGWIEGQNISLQLRFADLKEDRLTALAQELVQQKVDLIVAVGTQATQAARRATASIPIVMSTSGDPIGSGTVRNLARPEANVTGTSLVFTDVAGKRLQLLQEVTSRVSRAAVLSSGTPVALLSVDELRVAGARLGVEVQPFVYGGLDKLRRQFAEMQAGRAESLVVVAAHVIDEAREPLAQLALRHRLPTMFTFREYVEAGGLMSYGPNLRAMHRRAAYYVDRLLRGAKPADLPVEQPTKFELVINLKTAKALGLTIPPSVLGRADQVID
jgi:putative tryptophan/tyrosine transport system substrate-binding protein